MHIFSSHLLCLLNMKDQYSNNVESCYFCPAFFFSVQQKFSDCRTAVQQHLRRFHEDCVCIPARRISIGLIFKTNCFCTLPYNVNTTQNEGFHGQTKQIVIVFKKVKH